MNQLFPETPLEIIRDFGPQPVSSRFPMNHLEGEFLMNLTLGICPRSGLVQLDQTFPPEELKPRVPWITAFEPEGHLDELADKLACLPGLSPQDWIAGYSSKDDSLLQRLANRGFHRQWRLDPLADLGISDPCAFVETFQIPFTSGAVADVTARLGKPKLFLVRHVLEHAYDLLGFMRATHCLIDDDGYVVFEVPDCSRAFENLDYSTVWEEHSTYFTKTTLHQALTRADFDVFHFECHAHPFEDCMVAVCRLASKPPRPIESSSLKEEIERARRFGIEFELINTAIHNRLRECRANGLRLALFGAGHLAVAFTCLHQVSEYFEFVVDDNPNKSGRYLAGTDLEICPSTALIERHVDICLLALNPEHEQKILHNNPAFLASGGKFGSVFPSSPSYFFA